MKWRGAGPICPVLENALRAPNLNYGHQKVAKLVTAAAGAGAEPVPSCVVASPILGMLRSFCQNTQVAASSCAEIFMAIVCIVRCT